MYILEHPSIFFEDEDDFEDTQKDNYSLFLENEGDEASITSVRAETANAIDLLDPNEKAAQILKDAESQRVAILEETKMEAKRARESAYSEGWKEGKTKGEEAGLRHKEEVGRKMEETNNKREEVLAKLLFSIHRERERLLWEAEGELLGLSVEIARQIVLSELKTSREAIVDIVRGGLRRLTNKQGLIIRVSSEDKGVLLEHRDDLQSSEDLVTLTIVSDPQLKPGDCVIETTSGSVDGRLETRISEARKLLLKKFDSWEVKNVNAKVNNREVREIELNDHVQANDEDFPISEIFKEL